MVKVWTLHKDGKSLISIEGVKVDIGILPEYDWILSEYPGRGVYISEGSSGLRAYGPADSAEAAIRGVCAHYGAFPEDKLTKVREHIASHKERTMLAALALAGGVSQ